MYIIYTRLLTFIIISIYYGLLEFLVLNVNRVKFPLTDKLSFPVHSGFVVNLYLVNSLCIPLTLSGEMTDSIFDEF